MENSENQPKSTKITLNLTKTWQKKVKTAHGRRTSDNMLKFSYYTIPMRVHRN